MADIFYAFCDDSAKTSGILQPVNSTVLFPRLAACVHRTWFSIIPTLFLVICLPLILLTLHKSTNGKLQPCSPIVFRIIGCLLLILILCITIVGEYMGSLVNGIAEQAYFQITQVITLFIVLLLSMACRNRGIISSGVLFNFWLLFTISTFPACYEQLISWIYNEKLLISTEFYLDIASFGISFLNLFSACFADKTRYQTKDAKHCPEDRVSFLNQITFWWFDSMARLGNRRALVMEDLWELSPSDGSRQLGERFNVIWNRHIQNYCRRREWLESQRITKVTLPNGCSESHALHPNSFDGADSEKPRAQLHQQSLLHSAMERLFFFRREDDKAAPSPPSVIWPLFCLFKWEFFAGACFKLVFDVLQFVSPPLLNALIGFIQDKSKPPWIGYTISLSMFLVAFLQSLILHQYFHIMFRLGMNIRSILSSAVYKKALLLSNNARKNRTIGEIVNLMSVDIQRLQDITSFVMLFWSSPLQILLAVYFLWRLLGVAVIAGLTILIALLPLNSFISLKMRTLQVQQMRYKDERLKIMSEMLNGIKVLKLYAWEASMQKAVLDVRRREAAVLRKLALINAAAALSWSCAPFLVAVLTFGIYVNIDSVNNVLTPQITFVGLSLFNILRFPLAVFAMIIGQAIQCAVGNRRLKTFLAEEEINANHGARQSDSLPADVSISIQNASYSWDKDGEDFNLQDVSLNIKKGQLVAVVGRIGSGKSSLLSAILGDMYRWDGSALCSGKIAYVPQQPWIQNLTLKENVLFGKAAVGDFYERVLDACALTMDLEALPAGDQTEIGEKGINLSGGQKQRVSLARAVYSDFDIYLLDDPLSAVDVHVGKHIFESVLSSKTGLLKDKTRVFVTHGLSFLKHCDQIIVLKDGRISETGTYKGLLTGGSGGFADVLEEYLLQEARNRGRSVSFVEGGDEVEEVDDVLAELERLAPEKTRKIVRQLSIEVSDGGTEASKREKSASVSPTQNREDVEPNATKMVGSDDKKNDGKEPENNNVVVSNGKPLVGVQLNQTDGNNFLWNKNPDGSWKRVTNASKDKFTLIEKEGVQTGHVSKRVYLTYIRAIGWTICILFLLIYTLSSVLGVSSNLWLADWSDHAAEIQSNTSSSFEMHKRLLIYTGLGMGQALFVTIASIVMSIGMVHASVILHEVMLKNILRSPMSFFDVTPIGRILNRFGKDVDLVDTRLPTSVLNFFGFAVTGITTLAVPIIVTPLVGLPILVICVVYIYVTDIDCLDTAIPRSLLSFVRMGIASIETVTLIALAVPKFVFALVPLSVLYGYFLRFYVSTSRQLKRLESITRSPIYAHFQESVQGASSIRAFDAINRFLLESQKRVDYNLVAYFPSIVANRWLAIRLELIGNCIVLFSAVCSVYFRDYGSVTAGLVGLSVSYALSITQTLNWAVRMTSELEANIVSVERIEDYSHTPTEASLETSDDVGLTNEWPTRGEILFEDVELRYRPDLEPILRGVSARIRPEEKVGIIGRTGAGKSSLTLALFRLVEPSAGRIVIDDLDIGRIGLHDLRSRLTIVPQDPVLFSGSLRKNLDPFDSFDDADVWSALKLTHLDGFVGALPGGIAYTISESGENLSVGQRQLICLARALLRKSKVLILDEAAASVDVETDNVIQRTIREQFSACTVLTIAHRLQSVMDSDRLLVFDLGAVVDFDTPQALLSRTDSLFHQLAVDAGILVESRKHSEAVKMDGEEGVKQ